MPTYQYICKTCGHELEELQSIKEAPLVKCPQCGQDTLARAMGSGSGLIFKGSGFYLTDYVKSESQKSAAKSDKKDETKTEGSTPAPPPSDTKTSPPPSPDSKKE